MKAGISRIAIGLMSVTTAGAALAQPTVDSYQGFEGMDEHGRGVAVWGDLCLMGGIDGELGRVAAYVRRPDPAYGSVWFPEELLIPDGGTTGDFSEYGLGLAIHGSLAAVGHPGSNSQGVESGAVYLLERISGRAGDSAAWFDAGMVAPAKLGPGDRFGAATGVWGTTLVAGAPGRSVSGQAATGATFVFTGTQTPGGVNWGDGVLLSGSFSSAFDAMGESVAIGEGLIVASSGGSTGAAPNDVLGYVFALTERGSWVEEAVLTDEAGLASLGDRRVALSGDTIAMGVAGDDPRVWVFRRSPGLPGSGAWTLEQLIEPPAANSGAFGSSVSLHGDTLVVGDPEREVEGMSAGSAHRYVRSAGDTWVLDETHVPALPNDGARFGEAVACGNAAVIIGAPGHPMNYLGGLVHSIASSPDCDGDGLADAAQFAVVEPDLELLQNKGHGTVSVISNVKPVGVDYLGLNRIDPPEGLLLDAVRVSFPETIPEGHPFRVAIFVSEAIANPVQTSPAIVIDAVRTSGSPDRLEWVDLPDLNLSGLTAYVGVQVRVPAGEDPIFLRAVYDPDLQIADPRGWVIQSEHDINLFNLGLTPLIVMNLSGTFFPVWDISAVFSDMPDCNDNGIPDACDIATGTSSDVDQNGLPDECDCDGNGVEDVQDIAAGDASDCNSNDVPDACEIALGVVDDCDGDGVPDECLSPSDYALTDLLADGTIPFSFNNFDLLTINQFTVEPGMETVVGLRAAWGLAVPGGHPAQVALLSDPDQDGHPADAELIASVSYTSAGVTVPNEVVDLPPTVIGEPGTSFFVALLTNQKSYQKPVGLDTDAPIPGRSFYTGTPVVSGGGSLVPSENLFPLNPVDFGNFTLHAVAANPLDLDADGVPDVCQGPPTCAPDVTGDGVVDTLDLNTVLVGFGMMTDEGDTNGDGIVDSLDLNAVLVAFGSVCE